MERLVFILTLILVGSCAEEPKKKKNSSHSQYQQLPMQPQGSSVDPNNSGDSILTNIPIDTNASNQSSTNDEDKSENKSENKKNENGLLGGGLLDGLMQGAFGSNASFGGLLKGVDLNQVMTMLPSLPPGASQYSNLIYGPNGLPTIVGNLQKMINQSPTTNLTQTRKSSGELLNRSTASLAAKVEIKCHKLAQSSGLLVTTVQTSIGEVVSTHYLKCSEFEIFFPGLPDGDYTLSAFYKDLQSLYQYSGSLKFNKNQNLIISERSLSLY